MILQQEFASSGGIHPPLAVSSKDDSMMESFKMITQPELKKLLHYNPETGVFVWLEKRRGINIGDIAGYKHKQGYIFIFIGARLYLAHRLAWFYVYGVWPKEVDHIDHIADNNALINLRNVTHKENGRNVSLSVCNTSGVTGVCWSKKSKKWYSHIKINGTKINLGFFNDFFEAACARLSANNKFGFHENHGK